LSNVAGKFNMVAFCTDTNSTLQGIDIGYSLIIDVEVF